MKKLVLVLTLLGAFSSAALADKSATTTATGNDSMGMMAAFMGVSEVAGGEVVDGVRVPTVAAASSVAAATSSVITTVTNSNVTTSTPYSYKK
ncbi:MAG: hypothetical protein ACRC6B_02720 [Fusobacteriaceae bacterium]